jgi:hypothetical protein
MVEVFGTSRATEGPGAGFDAPGPAASGPPAHRAQPENRRTINERWPLLVRCPRRQSTRLIRADNAVRQRAAAVLPPKADNTPPPRHDASDAASRTASARSRENARTARASLNRPKPTVSVDFSPPGRTGTIRLKTALDNEFANEINALLRTRSLAEPGQGGIPPPATGASQMRPYIVSQHGRYLFTVRARSKRHALALIAARLSDTTGVTIAKGGAR